MSRTLATALALLTSYPLVAAPAVTVADGKVVVTGVASDKGLSVVVAEGTEDEIAARPAVSGEWTTGSGKVLFTPKYPLKPGTKYRVLGTGKPLDVLAPKPAAQRPARLTHIHPAAPELPENVLRFYLEFDRPMPRGDSYSHVRLLNEKGEPDPLPFVEIDELWNADQTRLTLLVDPGRIKKEVKPRIDLGPVFQQGKKYTLVVSGKWPTLSGDPLGDDTRKPITVTAPIADALDPKDWNVSAPTSEGGELRVAFGRPMDRPILLRALTVLGPDGKPVAGTADATDRDRTWTFRPKGPWATARYTLRVDPVLEDVCGNRVGQPFEVDLLRVTPKETKPAAVDLPFAVGRR
jgi:hypothetical protein